MINFLNCFAFLLKPSSSEWVINLYMPVLIVLLRYAQLLVEDRILLCLVDSQGNIMIFLNKLSRIDAAIKYNWFAKFIDKDKIKIGQTCLFAFNESKRMLAVYASFRVCSYVFRFIQPELTKLPRCSSTSSYLMRNSSP